MTNGSVASDMASSTPCGWPILLDHLISASGSERRRRRALGHTRLPICSSSGICKTVVGTEQGPTSISAPRGCCGRVQGVRYRAVYCKSCVQTNLCRGKPHRLNSECQSGSPLERLGRLSSVPLQPYQPRLQCCAPLACIPPIGMVPLNGLHQVSIPNHA